MKFLILFLVYFILDLQESQAQHYQTQIDVDVDEYYSPWYYVYNKDEALKREDAACLFKKVFHNHKLTNAKGYLDRNKILSKLPEFSEKDIRQYRTSCPRNISNTEESNCAYTKCILDNHFHEELAFEYIMTRCFDNEADVSLGRKNFWDCMEKRFGFNENYMTFYNPTTFRGAPYTCIMKLLRLTDKDGVPDQEKILVFAKNSPIEKNYYFGLDNHFQQIYDLSKRDTVSDHDTDQSGVITTSNNVAFFTWLLDQREVFYRLFLTQSEMEKFVPPQKKNWPRIPKSLETILKQ